MDRKKLLHILDKNLNELLEINQEMSQSAHLSKLEIDIALAKAKLIYQEYEFLQEINSPQVEKTAVKVEAPTVVDTSPTLFDLPPAAPVNVEVVQAPVETILNDFKEAELNPQVAIETKAEPEIVEQALSEKPIEEPAWDEIKPQAAAEPEPKRVEPIVLPVAKKEVAPIEEAPKAEPVAPAVAETPVVEEIKAEEKPQAEKAAPKEVEKPVEKFELQEEKPLKPEPLKLEEPAKKPDPAVELVTPAASSNEKILEKETPPKNGTTKNDAPEKKTVIDQFQAKSLNDTISSSNKLEQRLASAPIQKLENSIGLNDRFQYIRELFNNDADLFRDTITKIDKMYTIDEALDFLDSQFEWEMDDISLKFIHLVRRRFSV